MIGLGYRGVIHDAMTQPAMVKLGVWGRRLLTRRSAFIDTNRNERYLSGSLHQERGEVVGPGFAYYWSRDLQIVGEPS